MTIQGPQLEYLFSYTADIEEPQQSVGVGAFGHRMIARVTGGQIEGPRLSGRVLPGGGDWALIEDKKTLRLDARITLESDEGALIFASYQGVITPIDPATVVKVISGEADPSDFYFRTTPRFETGDDGYAWLNTTVCVAVGNLSASGVSYDVFAVL